MRGAAASDDFEWTAGRLAEDSDEAVMAALLRGLHTVTRSHAGRAVHRRRTLDASARRVAALGAPTPKVSLRVGEVDGHPTRSCFFSVEPAQKAGPLLRYTHRLNGVREEELESRGGMAAERFEALAKEREGTVRKGMAAAYSAVLELPFETSPETRADIMQAIAAHFRSFGATWAVHSHNSRGEEQPHGHCLILAGPHGERPIDGPEAMKAVRRFVAETVNRVALEKTGHRLPREWHGGTLADTGIDRPPRPNIPRGLYRARQKRDDRMAQGRPVTERVRALAAAADRIDAAYERDRAAGRPPEPMGLERRRARLAERAALIAEIADRQRRIAELESAREDAGGARHHDVAADRALDAAHQMPGAPSPMQREPLAAHDQPQAEVAGARDVTATTPDATAAAPAAQPDVERSRPDTHVPPAADSPTGDPPSAGPQCAPADPDAAPGPTLRDVGPPLADVLAGDTAPATEVDALRARVRALEASLRHRSHTDAEWERRLALALAVPSEAALLRVRGQRPPPAAPSPPRWVTVPGTRKSLLGGTTAVDVTVDVAPWHDAAAAAVEAAWRSYAESLEADLVRTVEALAANARASVHLREERPLTAAEHHAAIEQAERRGRQQGLREAKRRMDDGAYILREAAQAHAQRARADGRQEAQRAHEGAQRALQERITQLQAELAVARADIDAMRRERDRARREIADRPVIETRVTVPGPTREVQVERTVEVGGRLMPISELARRNYDAWRAVKDVAEAWQAAAAPIAATPEQLRQKVDAITRSAAPPPAQATGGRTPAKTEPPRDGPGRLAGGGKGESR